MSSNNLDRWWLIITFVLIIILASLAIFFVFKRDSGREILILSPAVSDYQGQIFIDGAVMQPGIYR